MVSVWSTKVISRSPHMFISRLLTSCALLFRLSFRGTISYIITAFVSDFNDSVRSVTDIDIWLAVLLILSSFVPTSNIMWFGLNYQMVALTWSYIQLTLTPLNDRTLISVLFRIFFMLRGIHLRLWQYYTQVWPLYFLCYWRALSYFHTPNHLLASTFALSGLHYWHLIWKLPSQHLIIQSQQWNTRPMSEICSETSLFPFLTLNK